MPEARFGGEAMLPTPLRDKVRLAIRKPGNREKLVRLLRGVSKVELQQASKVRILLEKVGKELQVHFTPTELATLTNYFVSLRIDPNNPLHLIKLWTVF
jgi:hypothetical protein